MRVAVIGAGAIGGWLTAGFVRGGAEAVVLARGATLAALRRDGLQIDTGDGPAPVPVTATDAPGDLRGADVLLLGVKAHDLPALAPTIEAALSPETVVVPAINGLPWWFLQGFGSPAENLVLDSVDPGGALARLMPVDRVVGAVIHAGSLVVAPGHIRVMAVNRVLLGDPGGGTAAARVAEVLAAGGIPAQTTGAIRREVWSKLWGNSNMNPLSALARADMLQLLDDDGVRGLTVTMMQEMAALGARIGLDGFDDIEERITTTRKLGPFRTSMLQDLEAGRALELGPILGALVELAAHLGQPVPVMAGVHGLTRILDQNLRQG